MRRRPDVEPDDQRKGARTRGRIVREAAGLFNTRGVAGTSVSDVSAATGLEKGGIYNHFATKDDLAVAAFDYAASLVGDRLRAAMRERTPGGQQLRAMLDVYRKNSEQPFVPGGCPLLNTAVEADDTHPRLRSRTRAAMDGWLALVVDALDAGRAAGEFRADLDTAAAAHAIVAGLEGGIMLSRLYREPARMHAVIDQLTAYLDSLRPRPA